jgi:hypothetical protein
LEYQNNQIDTIAPPLIKDAYLSTNKYIQRLLDVEDELGEIGRFFEESALRNIKNGEEEISGQIAEEINRNRIPGFRAFHLASEGLAVLHLLSINIAYLESSQQLDSEEKWQQVEKITHT